MVMVINVIEKDLKGFKDEKAAYRAVQSLRASFTGDEAAKSYCRENRIKFVGAQTGGTDSAGGYTVPDEVFGAIHAARAEHGVARKVCRRVPMNSDKLDSAKRNSGQTVDLPGEAGTITAGDVDLGVVELSAVKRAVLSYIANELIDDSAVMILDEFVVEAGHVLARREDNDLLNGDGSADPYGSVNGLIDQLGTAGVVTTSGTTYSTATLANFHSVMALIESTYYKSDKLCWIMNPEFYAGYAVALLSAAGLEISRMIDGTSHPFVLGYPVHFSDQMPAEAASATAALFGNFYDSVMLGSRAQGEWQASQAAGFNTDSTVLRVVSRYDIVVHESADGSNKSAYSGLKLAAS